MKHSIFKQIKNDYFTFLPLCGIIILSIFLIGILFFGIAFTKRDGFVSLDNEMQTITGTIFCLLDLLCIMSFIYRIYKGNYFVNNGIEINAEIDNVWYFRDRGRVEYIYKIDDKIFKRGNGIHITKITMDYNKGDVIKILVDPRNTKKAVIKNHFVNL